MVGFLRMSIWDTGCRMISLALTFVVGQMPTDLRTAPHFLAGASLLADFRGLIFVGSAKWRGGFCVKLPYSLHEAFESNYMQQIVDDKKILQTINFFS